MVIVMSAARDHIIKATCDLLELQGYHATGLNQIIKDSGSPKGSLYHYFPGGKEELTAEAISTVGALVLNRIRDNLADIDDPAEAVGAFIANIAHNVEVSGYRAGGPITTVAMETAATSERLRAVCQGIYAGWAAAFAHKLRTGGLSNDRADRLSQFIIAAIEGGIILCRTGRSRAPLEIVADEIRDIVAATLSPSRTLHDG
jgi:TetR/AcrR family transcriptional repressor of lmrAB and yxaGH operons